MGSKPSKIQRPDSVTGSDEYKITVKPKQYEFVCTTCARDNKHVNANSLCNICQDCLCFKCLLWHGKYRSDHVDELVGLDEMRKLGVQEPPVIPAEKCVAHDGELWNMLCPKDGVTGCKRCMEQDHRSCGSAIPRSSRQIEAVNRQMKKTSLPKKDMADNFEFQRNNAQLNHSSGEDVSGIPGENSERSDDGQVSGKKYLVDTNDLQVSGQKITVGQNKMTNTDDGSKPIYKTSMTDDGQVSGIRSKHHEINYVKSSREVNVRITSDTKTCGIHDLCLLSDGRLLMSDFNNKKVKLLDCNINVIDHCDFQYSPKCICMVTDTEAAVVVGRSIQIVAITRRIEMMRSIELDHCCDALAYSNGELYVSDMENNIHVYTVDGQKLRIIETGLRMSKYSSGLEWLTVSKDRSRLFMTKLCEGIVCIEILNSQVVWKINDTDRASYNGLCVDSSNNVFVCRRWKNDIVQISFNGQLSGVVVDGLLMPQSICIDEVRGRLIVGFNYSDSIRVFDLKI